MKKMILVFCLLAVGQLQGAIILNGQLQTANAIDITKAMGDSFTINADGDSVVNIYYEDKIENLMGRDFFGPGFRLDIGARQNATINFIMPENDRFYFYLWDTEDNLPANFRDIYLGLELNANNYSNAGYTQIWRYYTPDVGHVLSPVIGDLVLRDMAKINFVPEPATLLLFGMGGLFICKHKKHETAATSCC